MTSLVCFVEGPSEGHMLKSLLPRLHPDLQVKVIAFQGKQDLEKRLGKRLKYWQEPDSLFLVMRDQDSGDCMTIKKGLQEIVKGTGKGDVTLIRIACRELESFYLGDLQAVEKGLKISGLARHQQKSKFRSPDALGNPAEELTKLTKKKYQKMSGSRAIVPHLDLNNNRSKSFKVLLSGLRALVETKAS